MIPRNTSIQFNSNAFLAIKVVFNVRGQLSLIAFNVNPLKFYYKMEGVLKNAQLIN